MNKKAQALLELALFVGLMLMVLLAALSYQRNLREQNLTDINVFAQVKKAAFGHHFIEHDEIDNTDTVCSGAIVSYSLNVDRQANRLFQGGQRRTAASSASVYYSNSEDPPNLDYNYYYNGYNDKNIDIGPEVIGNEALKKKIYEVRPGGTEDPVDGVRTNALQWIGTLYPVLEKWAGKIIHIKNVKWNKFWKKWGGWLNFVIRTATFVDLGVENIKAEKKMEKTEAERAMLKVKDDQMGEWGWRVCNLKQDGQAKAGRFYVKDVTAQVFAMETKETKNIDYDETQKATPEHTSTRNVTVGDTVTYKLYRRYDTSINPTLPLAQHTFEDFSGNIMNQGNFKNFAPFSPKEVTVDLSGVQNESWN